ncbi:MAG TPA: SMC-Scp complex subunit ScpB [Bacillota bacterium]|nr:SMC-Scp complex subunit ScpB [Bacillota bacterium]
MASHSIKSALESLLFVWGEPLEAKAVAELFGISAEDAVEAFRELAQEYANRRSGLAIREIDRSFQLCTNPQNDDYIQKFCTPVKEKRLSQSALEVLAVIAYRQPVTKGAIDSIRGIRSDRVLEGLLRKELIVEKGRASSIGRPILYGTTKKFLKLFGFANISELPELDDIISLLPEDAEEEERSYGQLSLLDHMSPEDAEAGNEG